MTYVGSASLIENRIDLCVPKPFQQMVVDAPDAGMRELLKDYVLNKQFRRDIYIKGPQQLSPREQRARLNATMFAPAGTGSEFSPKFQLPVGEVSLKPETIPAFTSALTTKPSSGADIIAAAEAAGVREGEAIMI